MNPILRVTQSTLSALGLAALLACGGGGGGGDGGGGNPTPTITSVSVTPATANLSPQQTQTFTATVSGTGAYSSAVTWSGSGAAFLSSTSSNAPTFTASTAGTFTLTATSTQDASKAGSATVTVVKTIADTLTYANPGSGTYQLVKNTSKSTAGHLVLDLIGPAGSLSGVGFYLSADQTKVTWTTVDSGDAEKVKSATFSNTIVKSKVSGDTLQAGVFQKGTTAAVAATSSTVLASVALDLKAGVANNSSVSLAAVANKAAILNAPGNPTATSAITLSVGTLTAN